MSKTVSLVIIGLLATALIGVTFWQSQKSTEVLETSTPASPSPTITPPIPSPTPTLPEPTPTSTPQPSVVAPIAEFKARITKKFFGTYITPAHSPVQPERFTGYHTGVDVEYTDVSVDVPVYAIASGTVVVSKWASGYGGVIEIKHQIDGQIRYAVYGHLRQSSMVKVGAKVAQGQQIAVLGTGYSQETDNERRHLHFSVASASTILGYAKTTAQLNATWIDPLKLYP